MWEILEIVLAYSTNCNSATTVTPYNITDSEGECAEKWNINVKLLPMLFANNSQLFTYKKAKCVGMLSEGLKILQSCYDVTAAVN